LRKSLLDDACAQHLHMSNKAYFK